MSKLIMNFKKENLQLFAVFVVTVFLLIFCASACEYDYDIKIKNDTDRTLTIFFRDERQGEVFPGKQITGKWDSTYRYGVVEARDIKGNIVYSKEFTVFDIHKMKDVIVIHQSDLKNQ